MINEQVANLFEEMGFLLEMKEVEFKPRAYEKASEEIRNYSEDLEEIYKKGGVKLLEEIPGVGEGMAQKIEEFIKSGKIKEYEDLKKELPINLKELSSVEGLGPKMIAELYKKLKITNLMNLERLAKSHKISALPGFGEKTEQNILKSIEFVKLGGDRKIFGYILPLARKIEDQLKKVEGVKDVVVCGSIRRGQETIGDIDIVAIASSPKKVVENFVHMPEVSLVHTKGQTSASVRLNVGLDADLLVESKESYGAAVLHFTGDKAHNIALRKIAIKQKMKLNEKGLFKGKKRVAGISEEEIYQKLGLQWIAPELRTDSGEIEAAQTGSLPKLLPYNSVRGDLQVQTNWTDGSVSIEEMAEAAMKLGLEYIAITDHTKSLAITGGLDEAGLAKQGKAIDKLNEKFKKSGKKFRILKGAEVNILKDGSLDIDNTALAKLDVVGVSVHTAMKLSKTEMTQRILKAISNPNVDILFHPTGRQINRRPPYDVDMEEIIKAAKKYKVALELDCYPDRTDIKDVYVRKAIKAGIKITIDSDAHSIEHLRYLKLGEITARRGWAEKKDVLNTKSAQELIDYFKSKD